MKYHDGSCRYQGENRGNFLVIALILSLRFSKKTTYTARQTLENRQNLRDRRRPEGDFTPNMGYRFGGQRLCWNKQIRTDMLDAAVWDDVRRLLSEPERIRKEYERRLQGPETGPNREVQHLSKMVRNVKKMISRLIDAYGEGLLDKSEFEPRISVARERLAKLEAEYRQRIGEVAKEAELRLVIGQLEEFASRVSQGLQEPDWETRREVVRALVKQVEIDEQEVRIVYRVSPSPFEGGPQQGRSQHCWGRAGL